MSGGSRNCVRCRWFVTEPHYLPALAAHFNTLAYHFDEARNACLARENEFQDLKKQKADSEESGQPLDTVGAQGAPGVIYPARPLFGLIRYFSPVARLL